MHVKSAQGKGSTFSFTSIHDQPTRKELVDFLRDSGSAKDGLPITDSPILSDATVTKAPPFKMICVAEDNPINLKHLSKHLTILGYAHVTAVNGQEALDKFCAADNAIDAVIIDMSMPVMGMAYCIYYLMRISTNIHGNRWSRSYPTDARF